ncbi:MAG TPA: DEAD/DEAH box helicase family protein, partial [Burkholderiaceae bacterium]|nr:DEAD/DEAH box helicase family protein [Burkholderiaceae bacterium]
MTLHREVHFESGICTHLGAHGWLYEPGAAAGFDAGLGLYLPDLLAWLEATQPEAFAQLDKTHGPALSARLGERVRRSLGERGTLDVLRHGVEMLGLRRPLDLAQFRPALTLNPAIQARYGANRLRVLRQVHHSPNRPNDALDLVLCLNGIPVATAELKSDYTQSVHDAVDQYRADRLPQPKGGLPEPLLAFPGAALVHFALSQSEVMMCTRLDGARSVFLPFNRGNSGAAGNPPNPDGFATAYLWEEVWARDGWLDILHRYLIGRRDAATKRLSGYLFPRYHQLDATRRLVADVQAAGPGQRYLIQHSAGSGKTHSIAWTAHFLADLHDAQAHKLFDSVLVISDRTVLDDQLQAALFDSERTLGVVASIRHEHGSKSAQLTQALKDGKKIIVCTLQTFPFALAAVQELAATEGKRFAVIADEAHSSQTGESAARLKQLLSAQEWAELQDGGEIDTEALLAAQMQTRAAGITWIAFTATPKARTLELFGRPGADGLPAPFHVYPMRQAIEEGFILDVLQNYTSYALAFRLAHHGRELDDRQVERGTAMQGLMQWVRLHPYNIASKVQIIIEHYREHVQPLLAGRAKAMVVLGSRLEAVRWHKAMRAWITRQRYPLGVLVAFSGEVDDPESHPQPVSERSADLNPDLKGRDLREVFDGPDHHLLLVANKFQTGFDQPRLCGLYVDKRLGGIQAVQTLSRLNRAHPGKDTTYVLDFVNDPADILAAFRTYYETAALTATTDPERIYDLRARLDASGCYDEAEVERVARVAIDPAATQK